MASSISLPFVIWHNFTNPNTTSLACNPPHVYAGQKDGHIWVYQMSLDPPTLQHKFLLVGHKAPVVALCVIKNHTNSLSNDDVLISAAEDGEIARWSVVDGRCQAVNNSGFMGVPRYLKVFKQFSSRHIFCCGQSNDIFILNATTLEVVSVWGGHANWVVCTDFCPERILSSTGAQQQGQQPKLVTMTMDGRLDTWNFDVSKQIIYKDKSILHQPLSSDQTVSTFNAHFDLISSDSTPGICMALTDEKVVIFALHNNNEFIPHITLPAKSGTSWTGGVFCETNRLMIWTQNGDIYDYVLHPPQGVKTGSMASNEQQLYYTETLVQSYSMDENACGMPESRFTAVYEDTSDGMIALLSVANDIERSTYGIQITASDISTDINTTSPSPAKNLSLDRSFADSWPLKDQQDPNFGHITATAPVSSNHLAIGYENGTICVVPFALALLHLNDISSHLADRDDVRVFEKAHDGEVTCMLAPEYSPSASQYLLSGGRDGAVKIWNLIDGKYVASNTVHAMPVEMFIEPAEKIDIHIRGCVVSVAKDNSTALISIDSMHCLYMFPGHPYGLSAIQWRVEESYLLLGFSDGTVFVWQLQSGHLDRVLTGTTAHDVLNDDRWPTNRLQTTSSSHKPWTLKHIASIKPILSHHQTSHVTTNLAHVFTFNIRRLANDLVIKSRGPAGLLAPALETSASTTSIDAVVPDMLTFRPDKDDPIDSRQDTEIPAHDRKLELVSSIISSVMSWHVSEAFEDICRKTVSPSVITDAHLSYGIKGTNGNLSILAPMKDEKEAWKVSISMTASRLLTIALLGKAIISMAGQDGCSSDLISSYAIALSAVIGKDYCFPSLSLLSKYWQDPSARCLFSSAVTGLSKEDIVSLVNYWEAFLPTSDAPESDGSQMMARASVILGIMGCDQPQMLSSRVRKSTALSLTILLSDVEFEQGNTDQATVSSASMARMLSSMELLSQGFSTWESYINASEVLRTLFQYASDKKPTMSLVSRGAKGAIFEIAVTNMPLVIGTLTFDTMHCKKIDDRIRCLQIIGQFIRKKPILLYYNVHRVVEAVVKTLDPNIPHMREQVLPAATAILHDLVKVYPFVDFSTTAQKLSVGTLEGASIIYDVRTATRSTVLEGHTGPVTVLAFSPDAKFIATCSLLDQTVRVWYANQSIFGMLTSSLSHGFGGQRHDQRDGTLQGSHKPYKIFSFALPNKEDATMEPSQSIYQVRCEWTSTRTVKLNVRDLVMNFTV